MAGLQELVFVISWSRFGRPCSLSNSSTLAFGCAIARENGKTPTLARRQKAQLFETDLAALSHPIFPARSKRACRHNAYLPPVQTGTAALVEPGNSALFGRLGAYAGTVCQ